MSRAFRIVRTLSIKTFITIVGLSMIAGPMVPAFPSVAHAEPGDEPTVTTGDPISTSENGATVGFSVSSQGASAITSYGVKYATDASYSGGGNQYDQDSTIPNTITEGSGGSFNLSGLACGTTYHYAAFATNDSGTGVGTDKTFDTDACTSGASVGFNDPLNTSPSDTSLSMSVYIADTHTYPVSLSFEYSLDGGDTWQDMTDLTAGGGGVASGNTITGIPTYDPSGTHTNIYPTWNFTNEPDIASSSDVKIRLTPSDQNGDGTPVTSDSFSITIADNPDPTVTTVAASIISQTGARLAAHLEDPGSNATITRLGVSYATDDYYNENEGSYLDDQHIDADVTDYSWDLSDLSCGTTYHFQAYATNADGNTGYGDDETFETDACDGSGSSNNAPEVGFTSQPTQADPGDAHVTLSAHVADADADNVYITVRYSLDGGENWFDAEHLSNFSLGDENISGATVGPIGTNGTDQTLVSMDWDFAQETSITDSDNVEVELSASDGRDGASADSDAFSIVVPEGGGGEGGGTGVEGDPYIITTCEQLEAIDTDPASRSAYYELGNDLDCHTDGNAVIIGSGSAYFTGDFDGAGHTITVAINYSGGFAALFASVASGASIHDLAVSGTVNGTDYTAGIAGDVDNATIARVVNRATITSTGIYTAGIAGNLQDDAEIDDSYNTGDISTNADNQIVGGIAGAMDYTSRIRRTYSIGHVTAGYNVGGLVGELQNTETQVIFNSFAAGKVTVLSTPNLMGGLVGQIPGTQDVSPLSNDYWDIGRSGLARCATDNNPYNAIASTTDCGGVNTISSDAYTAPLYFKGNDVNGPFADDAWDFDTVWETVDDGYPALRSISDNSTAVDSDTIPVVPPADFDGGTGATDDPYTISTCAQLEAIGQDDEHLAATYRLTDDIDCSMTGDNGDDLNHFGSGFEPIGTTAHPFTGTISGENSDGAYEIYGLYIDRSLEDNVGLFGVTNGATINHLYLTGSVTGDNFVGMLAGEAANSTISDVETGSSPSVTGTEYVGGLVGYMHLSNMSDSSYDGYVTGDSEVGGLVGYFDGDDENETMYGIENSSAEGVNITAAEVSPEDIGGLVGTIAGAHISGSTVDVSIDGSQGATTVGGVAGASSWTTLTENTVEALIGGYGYIGGLAGTTEHSDIENNTVSGELDGGDAGSRIQAGSGFGGLVGYSTQDDTIEGNISSMQLYIYAGDGGIQGIGGLAGAVCGGGNDCFLYNNSVTGSIYLSGVTSDSATGSYSMIGGLVGYFNGLRYDIDDGMEVPSTSAGNYSTASIDIEVSENPSATSQQATSIGGLFGQVHDAHIQQSFASGDVQVTAPSGGSIAGFSGEIYGSTLSDAFSSGSVTVTGGDSEGDGFLALGGFAGYAEDSFFANTYAKGDVTTTSGGAYFESVAGLIGILNLTGEPEDLVTNSFASGLISVPGESGQDYGGLIGSYQGNTEDSELADDYYYQLSDTGAAYCIGDDVDQRVGISDEGGVHCAGIDGETLPNSYFEDASNAPMSGNWDFSAPGGLWIEREATFPTLRGMYNPYTDDQFDGGTGTLEDPYQIGSCVALAAISEHPDAAYVLTQNIVCESFAPIGYGEDISFEGDFDGAEHSIEFYIDRHGYSDPYIGLFTYMTNAHIHDLTLYGSIASGEDSDYVGSLAGYADNSSIENVFSGMMITGGDDVGGIVGAMEDTNMNNVLYSGTLAASGSDVGGIAGESEGGYLFNLSLQDGTVTGHNSVGGLIGDVESLVTGGSVVGTVTGNARVGGAFGDLDLDSDSISVQQILSHASVTGNIDVGGFAGLAEYSNMSDAYADGPIAGIEDVGGLIGYMENTHVARSYASGVVTGTGYASDEANADVGGFAGFVDEYSTIADSFSAGRVRVLTGYGEDDAPQYLSASDGESGIAGFAGAYEGTDGFSGDYYDVSRSGQGTCAYSEFEISCTGINGDSEHGGYFIANDESAPLSAWDFDAIWQTTESYPELNLPIEDIDLEEPEVSLESPEDESTVAGTWSPSVDWGTSVRCFYEYGDDDAHEVDCSQDGSNIPAPAGDGSWYLEVWGYNGSGIESNESDAGFTYFAHGVTYTSGDGSEEHPYVIDSCDTLSGIAQHPTDSFVLAHDITCADFTPIDIDEGFQGTLDGANHTITITVDVDSGEAGLFTHVQNALIENLTIAGSISTGWYYAGAIAGEAHEVTARGVHVAANISAGGGDAGGLFGGAYDDVDIEQSYTSGTVTSGGSQVGGLIGYGGDGVTISDSYATGDVSGTYEVGGLFGRNNSGDVHMTRSYASGTVSGTGDNIGGLIGYETDALYLTDSFFDGVLSADDATYAGALVGQLNELGAYSGLWYGTRAGTTACGMFDWAGTPSPYNEGCSAAESDTQFIGNSTNHPFIDSWDFDTIWEVNAEGRPTLRTFDSAPDEDGGDDTPPAHHGGGGGRGGQSVSGAVSADASSALASLRAQLAMLLAQYKELTGHDFAGAPAALTGVRDLTVGDSGTDVKALQTLLITQMTGPAASALQTIGATGYFANYTRDALAEYQKAHGIAPAAGYFGTITRAEMKSRSLAGLWW